MPCSLVTLRTRIMSVIRIVCHDVHILIVVRTRRPIWRAQVLRHRSEWAHQALLFADLLFQSLNLILQLICFLLKLAVLLQKHLLIRCGLKPGDTPALLINYLVLHFFIHSHKGPDTHSSCSKEKSWVAFFVVDERGGYASTDGSFRIASEWLSKQTSQLRVSERHMH